MFSRKYLVWFNVFFCVLMSALFCFFMPLCSGAPTVDLLGSHGFLVSFLISLVVSLIVSCGLPVGKFGAAMATHYGARPGSLGFNLVTATFVGFLMLVALAFAMIAYNTGFGIIEGSTLFDRFVTGVIQFTPLVLITVFFLYPLCTALAEMVVKPADRFAQPAAGHAGQIGVDRA